MSEPQNAWFEARLTLAQADTTPAKVFTELSIDSNAQIRQAVALNPNTPADILLELGEEFPNEITQNPIFALLLLEEGVDSHFVGLSLARSTTTNENILIKLSEINDGEIHYAIARNPKTPISVLEKFAQMYRRKSEVYVAQPFDPNRYLSPTYKSYCILSAIVQNPNVPESLLHEIAGFGHSEVNNLLLQNPDISTSILEEIASVTNYFAYSDVQTILDHPNVSETAIAIINAMRGKCGIPSAILEKLVNHPNTCVRNRIALHPELTLELLLKLAGNSELHWELANSCSYLPPLAIGRIAEIIFRNLLSPNHPLSFEDKVIFWIARHHNTPIVILENLASNQPSHVYQRFGEDQFESLRAAVATNPMTLSKTLRKLSCDLKPSVRNAAQTALRARQSMR